MKNDLRNKTLKNLPKGHDRKPYVKPQLIEYGQIEKLTESGGGSKNEAHGTRRIK